MLNMNDNFKNFADLMGSLIAKYADKIDLDSLPDVQKCVENENNNEESMNCSGEPIAS